jgi:hypothetical protein
MMPSRAKVYSFYLDILELLAPAEIKAATLDTITGMFEMMQMEIEHSVEQQRLRFLAKLPKDQ